MSPMRSVFKTAPSPVGDLTLIANAAGLSAILWESDAQQRVSHDACRRDDEHPLLRDAELQLSEYFAGRRKTFELPLDFTGTEFQRRVWNALLKIPYGETRSYAQIAQYIGSPRAVRAVGAANGRNPICIVAPCHRVIGANGKLIGFAGGLHRKAHLLQLEGSARAGHSAPA